MIPPQSLAAVDRFSFNNQLHNQSPINTNTVEKTVSKPECEQPLALTNGFKQRQCVDELSLLAEQAQLGCLKAEAKLMKQCMPIIRSQVRKLASQEADVDDLVQESMIVLLKQVRSAKLKDPTKVRSYARSIARFQFFMDYRKRQRWMSLQEDESCIEFVESSDRHDEQFEFKQQFNKTWEKLQVARDKSLLIDTIFNGASKMELASKYKVKPAHVDRIAYRARTRFKQAWLQDFEADYCCS